MGVAPLGFQSGMGRGVTQILGILQGGKELSARTASVKSVSLGFVQERTRGKGREHI